MLQKLSWFGVEAGKSIVVPFGFIPLVIGLPSSDDEAVNGDCTAYYSNYLLESPEVTMNSDENVRHEIQMTLTRTLLKKTKILDGKREALKTWMKTWCVSEVE